MKKAEDAEDIFQDVFISLIENIHKIHNKEHLKYWLIRTTLNKTKNHFSCAWNKKVDVCNDFDEESQSIEVNEIRNIVLSLPSKFRDVVYLYYYEGYTIIEISKILKAPEGTVKSRLYNARKILKDELLEVNINEHK